MNLIRKTMLMASLVLTATVFAQQKGTFTDARDKKTYKTVKIGEQTWMAENLKFNAKNSKCGGTSNPTTEMDSHSGEEYTSYPLLDENTKHCDKYGRLYHWPTAMAFESDCYAECGSLISEKHRGVCPSGWHIPSGEEWDALVAFAGGEKAGSNLKAKSGWNNKGNGTDKYGFGALPGGVGGTGSAGGSINMDIIGFIGFGDNGGWWSSSGDINEFVPYSRCVYSKFGGVQAGHSSVELRSVRCIKD